MIKGARWNQNLFGAQATFDF